MSMNDGMKVIDHALEILRRRSVDGYEIYVDRSTHLYVESKDAKVDTFQTSRSLGIAFRILNRQRMGFSYITSSGEDAREDVERVIDDAIQSAEPTSGDPCFDFSPVLKESPPCPPIFDETMEETSQEAKIEKARRLEEVTRSVDPERITKVRKASYEEVISRITLVNSNGFQFSYASSLASTSVTAIAQDGGESEVGWDFDFSHFHKDLDVERVGRDAALKALERLAGRRIASGLYPILIRNQVASEFLSLLAFAFLSEQVQKGKSPLKGKEGERCFSPLLSIVDDGLHPKGISTSPIDGEGTPTQRTPLVVNGELRGYLYDRYWANRQNISQLTRWVESTGNSHRSSIKSPPGLGVSNLFIEPAKDPFPQLVKDLRRGVVIEEVMGLHTADPISGDFSLGCSGDWIENGERAYPVKSIAIAGNLFQLFKRVIQVGNDLRFFGRTGSPSLLIEELEVSGS